MSDKGDSDFLGMPRSEPDGAPTHTSLLSSFTLLSSSPVTSAQSHSPAHTSSKDCSFSSTKSFSPTISRTGLDLELRSSREPSPLPTCSRTEMEGISGGQPPLDLNVEGTTHNMVGPMETRIRPGEFVMRVLFAEFTAQAERKIVSVMLEPPERSLSKSLQRGEDPAFDQLLVALSSVSEHCLPSVLRTLFAWYDRQAVTWLGNPMASGSVSSGTGSSLTSSMEYVEKDQMIPDPVALERRDMAVEFIFCLVLIEVLKQLPFHPGHLDLVGNIEDLAFAHFKYREGTGVHAANGLIIADLYAEVLGVLAQARFGSVRIRFLNELAELRGKEGTASVTQSIVSLLMGMKFFRIKMVPIEDFEASFQFLTECAKYFLEVKQRDIKHALAGLFVETLVPVAASVKHEVNVPCLKSFMEMLYAPTLDLCTRSKHRLALFPLVTCLLCVSQRPFFLHNWHYFLAMCLSQLKSREPKMSRVALESLYRLLWAYMIRIKCESTSSTHSRLLSIVNSLFPKGSKGVVPRDTPLNIFVKIIQFIAQERLDFAMREIVFELLSVGRPIKIILTPERMNIGLRAFLVAADSLQQKDGDPPMPRSAGVMPSGNTLLRVKKTFLNKVLTEDTAKSIGMASYFPLIRKVFTDILRALDLQCGRPLLATTVKEQEESLLTGDRKAKIDLFRTCVAAIPRLIPDGMSRTELLSLLSRLTLHIDEELRGLAFQSLQSLLVDFPDWRNDVLSEFVTFASKDVPDTSPQQLDNALRMLLQLLTSWRGAVAGTTTTVSRTETRDDKERLTVTAASTISSIPPRDPQLLNPTKSSRSVLIAPNLATFYQIEGLALLKLCSVRPSSRRLAAHMLKELKILSDLFGLGESPVLDVIDKLCPSACDKAANILPPSEKTAITAAVSSNLLDLQWLTERSCCAWYTQQEEEVPAPTSHSTSSLASSLSILQSPVIVQVVSTDVWGANDPWLICLKEFLTYDNVPTQCPRAMIEAWPILMHKVTSLFSYLEPSPLTDNRASLLRSSATPRKPATDRNLYFKLWRNYLLFGFRTVPPNVGSSLRCISPEVGVSSSPEALEGRGDGKSPLPLLATHNYSPVSLYKMVLPLLRSEAPDIRDLAVHSFGQTNHVALRDLFEELGPYLREASDRKQENVRRRKRKDNLRLQLLRTLEMMAEEKVFQRISSLQTSQLHQLGDGPLLLPAPFVDFLDSAKGWLETDTDREGGTEMRIHFCQTIHHLYSSLEVDSRENVLKRDVRRNLFHVVISWAGPYAYSWTKESKSPTPPTQHTKLEFGALQAATALLTAGPIFQQSLLSEESKMYGWIDLLLASTLSEVSRLGERVVVTLLECNPDSGAILDWVVSRCFTGSTLIAEACFRSIAILFSAREYPCDRYVAIINTALLFSGSSSLDIQETAFHLLQILDRRFFGAHSSFQLHHTEEPLTLDTLLGRTGYAKGQTFLSRQLSLLHPELTMSIFSEISWRMKTASPSARQSLLRYVQPWLHNMELVEPPIPSPTLIVPLSSLRSVVEQEVASSATSCTLCGRKYTTSCDRILRRGWGSTEATEMVLNNLLYLTAKFGDEHARETEECWQTLCCLSPKNQRVVLYYLLIVNSLAPSEVLPYAKRVLIYLFRTQPLKLLEDLMSEIQTVESLNWIVERTETPPFYRLSHVRKTSSYSENQNSGPNSNSHVLHVTNQHFLRPNTSELEKGTIHTKRRSAEESSVFSQHPPHLRSSSSGTTLLFRAEKTRTISGPAALPDMQFLAGEKERARSALYESETLRDEEGTKGLVENEQYPSSETIAAHGTTGSVHSTADSGPPPTDQLESELVNKLVPLPMPEYGGYYAPLKELFPSTPPAPFHRSNMAIMFISELVTEGTTLLFPLDHLRDVSVDWCALYLPLMIHMAFLGLDHLRPSVHQHSYKLLINLLSASATNTNHLAIAKLLLHQDTKAANIPLTLPHPPPTHDFLAQQNEISVVKEEVSGRNSRSQSPRSDSPRTPYRRTHTPTNLLLVVPDSQEPCCTKAVSMQDMTLALIRFLAEAQGQPLWACEDITARLWNIKSANQLITFLNNVLPIFTHSFPTANLQRKWAQLSLQIGLACSSRHYAGRSLQVYRSLRVPLVSRTLCDILSRLVETVAEQGDDMQGYVTELILTLETCVDAIPVEQQREDKWCGGADYEDEGVECETIRGNEESPIPAMRTRSGTFGQEVKRPMDLIRSRSAQSLSAFQPEEGGEGGPLGNGSDVIPQVFWLGISLLESDYEHEYLLALGLLDKVMERLPLDRLHCRDKVDRMHNQLQSSTFPGVLPLILKGITNPNTYEQSLSLLHRFIPALDMSLVDPSGETGFPMTVMAFMPYLLSRYDDPNAVCIEAAQLIAEVAGEKKDNGNEPLQHLATVMTLYSRRSFTKESHQWTKCVIKYLYDSYAHLAPLLLGCLFDVLEKGPPSIQAATLSILHCSFTYVDLTIVGTVSPDLLKAIQKHLDGPHWKESLRILKLVVTRSSCLVAPAPPQPLSYPSMGLLNSGPSSMAYDSVSMTSSAFTSESESFSKKELPGRTMEFTFDVSQTPVIGRRHAAPTNTRDDHNVVSRASGAGLSGLHQRSGSVGEMGPTWTSGGVIQSAWKRPWQCQSRVRECLVSVLNACGQRVGLPKSPSVIFSQSSELLERRSSVASSTEEVSVAINDGSGGSRLEEGSASDAHFRVFRDFDFLEYELESVDGESSDNFNWGVRRRPLSELGTEPETDDNDGLMASVQSAKTSGSETSIEQPTVVSMPNTPRRPTDILPLDLTEDFIESIQTAEDSSDEDDLGMSPLDEVVPQLQEIVSSDPPTPQPHSLTMIEIPSSQTSPRSRRLSDTSDDDNTPPNTNLSPQPPEGPMAEEDDEDPLLSSSDHSAYKYKPPSNESGSE